MSILKLLTIACQSICNLVEIAEYWIFKSENMKNWHIVDPNTDVVTKLFWNLTILLQHKRDVKMSNITMKTLIYIEIEILVLLMRLLKS